MQKVNEVRILAEGGQFIQTLTVQYFVMLYISNYDFQTIMTPNGMELDISVTDGGHLMYYILLKPHEN